MDVKVFVYGIDIISLLCVIWTLFYADKYKGTSYFSPLVENQHNMLSWIAVVLAIIAFCIGRLYWKIIATKLHKKSWQLKSTEYNHWYQHESITICDEIYFNFIELKRRTTLCQKKETLSVVLTMYKS